MYNNSGHIIIIIILLLLLYINISYGYSCTNNSYNIEILSPKYNYRIRNDWKLPMIFQTQPIVVWPPSESIEFNTICYCNNNNDTNLCPRPNTGEHPVPFEIKNNIASYTIDIQREAMSQCVGQPMDITLRLRCYNAEIVGEVSIGLQVSSKGLSTTYIVTSGISILLCLFTIQLYFRFPSLRKFPSNMMITRTIIDTFFAAQLIWINANELQDNSNISCNFAIAFVTQFTLFASLAWYMALAINFHVSVSNPFTRPQNYMPLYHLTIWSISIITGIVIAFDHGYRSDYQLCWIPKTQKINILNWVFYLIWLVVFAFIAIAILIYGYQRLQRPGYGHQTMAKRREALQQTLIYVTAFTVYWLTAAIIWGVVYLETKDDTEDSLIQDRPLAYTFACVAGLMGFVDSIAWIFVQRTHIEHIFRTRLHHWCPCLSEIKWDIVSRVFRNIVSDDDDDSYHFDDISDALRFEFITNTSEGIVKSSKQVEQFYKNGGRRLSDAEIGLRMYIPGRSSASNQFETKETSMYRQSSNKSLNVPLITASLNENLLLPSTCVPLSNEGAIFKVYAPLHFETLRNIFDVETSEFIKSMQGDVGEMQQNFSEGRSGSFFYKTTDKKYLVKTLAKDEKELLLEILGDYIHYMKHNDRSLICRFYGLYSITLYDCTVYFAVMNNWLRDDPVMFAPLSEIYDLKGSTINRRTNPPPEGKVKTRKDCDLNHSVRVKASWGRTIKNQLKRDAIFLSEHNIMDYSLLLGIRSVESWYENNESNSRPSTRRQSMQRQVRAHSFTFASMDDRSVENAADIPGPGNPLPAEVVVGPGLYQLGIIDVLQRWNLDKRIEQWFKMTFKCYWNKWQQLSCVDPPYYAQRFFKMTKRVFQYVPPSQLQFTSPNQLNNPSSDVEGNERKD